MNGLKKCIASNNLNRSNSIQVSKNNGTKLDPKIAEILDSSLRQNSFLKPKKPENERIEHNNSPAPCFGQPKSNQITFQEPPAKEIQEEDDLFEDCAKAIAILNKYRNKVEPEINSRKLHTSISHFSRDTEANSREEPKSYAQLWKEGKDTREICKDKNALYSIIYENELLGNNTYLRQHLNRRIKSSAAALIIQKWFRDNSSGQKREKRSQSPKQDWVGVLSSNKGNLDSKIKKRQARRDNKSRCYEYEELETENGSLPMRHDHSGQKKILEEVSIQLKGNLSTHSGKKKSISATKKNKIGDKENFTLLEPNSRSNSQKPLKAKRRSDSLERMLGIEDSFSSNSYDIAAIQIQTAFRKYLSNKHESIESIKKLNQKDSFERKNKQEKEYLSLELKNSQKIIADLQRENENLKHDLVDLEKNIEKKIEEKVGIEKAKFKELLDQYTQFIDRLLQEKVDITQYYEVLTTLNQEMKLKLQKHEEKDYENIIANLQAENQKLEDEKSQIAQEAETFRENNHSSLLREVVQNLENENETLKTKIHGFINEKEAQFNEVNEANSRLLQKLRSSEVYIAELEEKLEISENRCKNLMEQSKNSNVGSGTVESLKSRIYIPRAMPENFISDDLIIKQQNNTYTPGKYDEDYILSVRNNTESETQSIPDTHRNQKPSLQFKLVESECDLPPEMSTDRLAPPETSQHLEFSFEAKDSVARSQSESENNHNNPNNNVIIESFEVDPAEADGEHSKEENFENKEIHRVQADFKIFEYRKMSQEYFSGKFVDEIEQHSRQSFEEDNQIQEQALDEEDQSLEINLLIENISKKLELAKLNRDGEVELPHEIKFTKALSLPKFEEAEERSPLYRGSNKARNLSQTNLHQNGLLFEEEEEEHEQETPEIDLPLQKQPNNFKKGVLDTLKKADLLFGRANI